MKCFTLCVSDTEAYTHDNIGLFLNGTGPTISTDDLARGNILLGEYSFGDRAGFFEPLDPPIRPATDLLAELPGDFLHLFAANFTASGELTCAPEPDPNSPQLVLVSKRAYQARQSYEIFTNGSPVIAENKYQALLILEPGQSITVEYQHSYHVLGEHRDHKLVATLTLDTAGEPKLEWHKN